jgi:hypothetical protein
MFENGQTFEQFLRDYYAVGPQGYLQYVRGTPESDLKKILVHTESNWYEYAYMKEVQLALSVNSEIYKLLDKKPITTVGNSFKYTSALGVDTTAIGPGGAEAIFGTSTEPTINTIPGITSGVEKVILSRDLHSMIVEKIPEAHPGEPDWAFLKNKVAPMALWNKIDTWLGGYETASNVHGVDTAAAKNIECIDRMISNGPESGDGTTYVSHVTDGDIIWDGLGSGTAKIDRSETSAEWTDAQIKLGTPTAGDAFDILSELDDLMAAAKKYSENKRYIGLTTDLTLNKIEAELDPKQRFLEKQVQVTPSIGGISTRPGVTGGFDVGALVLCGVTVPVFTSNALPTKNSKFTDATSGHFYLIDLDGMYIRVDLPATFLETGFGEEMLHQNYLRSRGMLFTVCQLVCTNFLSQAALKWIKL